MLSAKFVESFQGEKNGGINPGVNGAETPQNNVLR